jgi:hypothetical protein
MAGSVSTALIGGILSPMLALSCGRLSSLKHFRNLTVPVPPKAQPLLEVYHERERSRSPLVINKEQQQTCQVLWSLHRWLAR